MQLETGRMPWGFVRPGGNYSTNGYPAKIPATSAPSGDGVITPGKSGSMTKPYLQLLPFGAGSATNTFSFKVLGWERVTGGVAKDTFGGTTNPQGNLPLWIPVWLGTWQATIGTGTGVAGAEIGTGQLFATTLALTAGPQFGVTPADCQPQGYAGPAALYSPTTNVIGFIELFTAGFEYLEVIFTTGGSATSCNALWRLR